MRIAVELLTHVFISNIVVQVAWDVKYITDKMTSGYTNLADPDRD